MAYTAVPTTKGGPNGQQKRRIHSGTVIQGPQRPTVGKIWPRGDRGK